ncbi:CRISPR system Cascade subunit CasD [Actinoalloteichus hoggarensis]|uniref:CRISPR system Cascade subunit CasD n=1 Tax=Actinoalloteichus hoggarensis TaxID=1470176 RepID=A0A221W8F4_9PSEU|nr:type I-E CRISPR-associated protein Cas5/CasD [Actinoalloteichus hoggarensis]ASO21627.1 CRISPR system Cascade subunit CasD [Actinoalloteichus hoggarensis]MBB5922220.1 CRISPR system Cascade subunit CasD [Actinoalloteichus hoggarensis]
MTSSSTPGPAAGLLLHLTGPLQSWGEHSHFTERDTARVPTRSGVVGLLAAALGRARTEPISDLAALRITIRVDRPGVLLRDLHTVGGDQRQKSNKHTVTTAEGGKRPRDAATLLSHRYYLADAAFTVAVTALTDEDALLTRCAHALREPAWPLYLGRRSCPPSLPLFLGLFPDPLCHLVNLPLARPQPSDEEEQVHVDAHADTPLDGLPVGRDDEDQPAGVQVPDEPVGDIGDDPISFDPGDRRYRSRDRYTRRLRLPATQCAGLGVDYLTAVTHYLEAHPGTKASR